METTKRKRYFLSVPVPYALKRRVGRYARQQKKDKASLIRDLLLRELAKAESAPSRAARAA
jgi:hypothetical protein